MVHLITQFYQVNYNNTDKNKIRKRQDEITFCFKNNLNHPDVEKIHFLYENENDVNFLAEEGIDKKHKKIILYNLGERMKYSLIFNYANKFLQDKICVYLHSDMLLKSGFNLLNSKNMENKIFAITSHKPTCNGEFICHCTRQFNTDKGWLGVTFDGFAFKSPIKKKIIEDSNHIVHILGAETRTICILKENGYNVLCPNQILKCIHHHQVKVFATQHSKWINRKGEIKDQKYYSDIHAKQTNLPYEKKIVGGGIPFYMGSCELIDYL